MASLEARIGRACAGRLVLSRQSSGAGGCRPGSSLGQAVTGAGYMKQVLSGSSYTASIFDFCRDSSDCESLGGE